MGRLSWLSQVGPKCNHMCIYKKKAVEIWSQKRRDHMTEAYRSRGKPSQEKKMLVIGFEDGGRGH